VNVIVECGAVPALVKHLQVPPAVKEGDSGRLLYEHEVEKGSAFALGLLAVKVIRDCCLVGLVNAFGVTNHLNLLLIFCCY
jgi:hypothetical protein